MFCASPLQCENSSHFWVDFGERQKFPKPEKESSKNVSSVCISWYYNRLDDLISRWTPSLKSVIEFWSPSKTHWRWQLLIGLKVDFSSSYPKLILTSMLSLKTDGHHYIWQVPKDIFKLWHWYFWPLHCSTIFHQPEPVLILQHDAMEVMFEFKFSHFLV